MKTPAAGRAPGAAPGGGPVEGAARAPGGPAAGKRVRVQYFAMLREQARLSEETVATAAANPADLFEELRLRHGFSLAAAQVRVAVDGEFAAWDAPLADGACVVFVPPFAGG